MTKIEKQKTIDALETWVKRCESFYEHFEDVFKERPDAIFELSSRIDSVSNLNEYLYVCGFITVDKYLEVADRTELVWDKLRKLFNLHKKNKDTEADCKPIGDNVDSCRECEYDYCLQKRKMDWCLCTGRRVNELIGCALFKKKE